MAGWSLFAPRAPADKALSLTPSTPAPRPEVRPESGFHRTLRHGLPVVGVVVVVVLVASIAYFVYDSNRRGAVVLGNDLVTSIDRRVALQMQAYLAPPEQFLELADATAAGRGVFAGLDSVEPFVLRGMGAMRAVVGFSYGDPQGNFLYVVRNANGGLDSKLIDRRGEKPKITWTKRDAEGKVIKVEEDNTDEFDPRTRPWYQGAVTTKKPFWSDTYLFYTVKKPGITFSIPHFDQDGKLGNVIGIDIELASLDDFLKHIDIGHSGQALIVDRNWRVVAYPSDNWLPASGPDQKAPMLDELGDPVLARAYNLLRMRGPGRQVLDFANERIIVSSEPMKMLTGRDWSALIVVPETDFIGFVSDSALAALVMSVLVVLTVAGLSGLLAWRNLLAERRAAAAASRQQALELRSRTFVELARAGPPSDGGTDESLEAALETATGDCAAKRVAVWRLSPDRTTLVCEDCFDRTANDHTSGMELHRDQLPDLFASLGSGEPIDAADASQERRTEDLSRVYLKQLQIQGVYIMPIMSNGRLMGMVTVEDPQRGEHTTSMTTFCDALSAVLALRYTAAAPPEPVAVRAAAAAAAGTSTVGGTVAEGFAERQSRLEHALMQHDVALEDLDEAVIDGAAIAVLKLPAWTTVAKRPAGCEERTAMDAIVDELRRTIEQSGLSYAALLDDQIVLAAFSPDKAAAIASARCVATAVLDLRDRLLELEERWSISLDFSVAIDIGTVMASTVGTEPPLRHVWGGSVGIARVLASTSARRTIGASETAYELLADRFLFRPRGSYFLPETGNMRTFVMLGRI
ncbi:MAG: GAF domain-containing protein [Alphaproteobacteria bacterium]|nr:GAF domain-containing protein [Alphaproteobacteria bacterium]